jgi:tetratricopeptide (TPR) repeat protein
VAPRKETVDPQIAAVMKLYAEATKHFNKQSYRRAKEVFEKVLVGPSRELADRARVHLVICEQRMHREAPVHLRSADDHYHYAVSQINAGNYEEARARLERARKLAPKADYVYYALASVAALTGETDEASTAARRPSGCTRKTASTRATARLPSAAGRAALPRAPLSRAPRRPLGS